MGSLHPKARQKQCQAPLLRLIQVTGVIRGDVSPKDKTRAMPNPLAKRKKTKNDKQPYWTGVIAAVVTPKDKATKAKPPCQHDFKNEFVRLSYKTKYKTHCFQVLR